MDALSTLHTSQNPHPQPLPANPSMSGGGFLYNNLSFPQTSQRYQESHQQLPDNFDNDDKKDKKRMMNRLAAAKCRMKKMNKIEKLREKVDTLREETEELGSLALSLKEEVRKLKGEVYGHINYGCAMNRF